MGKSFWTEGRDQILREVADSGGSAQVAAEWIGHGCTRNMAIGRAQFVDPPVRFHSAKKKTIVADPIAKPVRPVAKPPAAISAQAGNKRHGPAKKPLAPIFNRPAARRPVAAEASQRPPQAQQTPIPNHHALVPCEGKAIFELGLNECRWPLGVVFDQPRLPDSPPRLFCAQECGEKVYCEAHMGMSRAEPRSRGVRTGVLING